MTLIDTATARHTLAPIYQCPVCQREVRACTHIVERKLVAHFLLRWELRNPREAERDGLRILAGDWDVVFERLATEEEVKAIRDAQMEPKSNIEGHISDDLQDTLRRIQEQPPAPVRRPPSEEEIRAQRIEARLIRARQAGVPVDLHTAITKPQERPALVIVRAWEKATGARCLLLHGANQAGKSAAAGAWLSSVPRGLWVSGVEIGLLVQPDQEHRAPARVRQIKEAHALVLDLSEERLGPAGWEMLESLIVHHLHHGRRLIVTTDRGPTTEKPATEGGRVGFFDMFGAGKKNRILSRWDRVGWVRHVGPWNEEIKTT